MHLVGLPMILAGTGVIVWGGARFVRDTFRRMNDPTMKAGVAVARRDPRAEAHAAHGRNLRMLLGAWKHRDPLLLGGYLINH